jgi:hypothetical protein
MFYHNFDILNIKMLYSLIKKIPKKKITGNTDLRGFNQEPLVLAGLIIRTFLFNILYTFYSKKLCKC